MVGSYVVSEAFVLYDKKIYASDMCKNGLFVYEQSGTCSQFAGLFPGEECDSFRIHSNAHLIGDRIWFVPDRGKHIHIVNPENNKIDSVIRIVKDEMVRTEYSYYINNKIVLFQNNNILRVFSVADGGFTDIEIPFMSEKAHLRRDISVEGNDIYFINNLDKVVFKLNTEENRIESTKVEGIQNIANGFGTIEKIGDIIWLSTQNGIIKYNTVSKETSLLNQFPDDFDMRIINKDGLFQEIAGFLDVNNIGEQPFSASIIWNNSLILFPGRVNMCIQINLDNEELKEFQLPEELEDEEGLRQTGRITHNHFLIRKENGIYYVTSTRSRRIYVFDNGGNYYYNIIPFNEPEWIFKVGKGVAMEDESTLEDYIKYLLR